MEHKKNINLEENETKKLDSSLFELISDEISVEIFSYLDSKMLAKLAQVSKKFNTVSADNGLWKLRINTTKRSNKKITDFKQFYISNPCLRNDISEFYAIGKAIIFSTSNGVYFNRYELKEKFSKTSIMNSFSKADQILLFDTITAAEKFVSKKTDYHNQLGSRDVPKLTFVIFKVGVRDLNKLAEIKKKFTKLDSIKNNIKLASKKINQKIYDMTGSLDYLEHSCIKSEKEDLILLSATLMKKYHYSFENHSNNNCLVM